MSTTPTPQPQAAPTATAAPQPQPAAEPASAAVETSNEIRLATLQLRLAETRSTTAFNASAAGQIQRQFEAMQRCAKPYAESTIVPTSYRGNIGNCIIALDLAYRMQLPALTVMQNLYIVNGNPSWASKFLVASINTCGRFTNLRYRKRLLGTLGKVKYNALEWDEQKKRKTTVLREFDATGIENWECVAYAVEKSTGETLEGDAVTIEMAIKEGWYTKDGSKWVTMPQLMLSYRAAAFWQRVYAPEMSMGFRTVEEERDAIDVDFTDITPSAADSAVAPDKTAPDKATVTVSEKVEAAKERLRSRQPRAAQTAAAKESSIFNDLP